MDVRVSIQARPTDRSSWLQMAHDVEAAGFEALYAADHPGSTAAPFVALAAAAAVTERIQLGTCVVNAGVWEPLDLANEVATLDVVSGGRAILGLGAGHTPQEWTATGRPYPSAADRVGRMMEIVEATTALLAGGSVSYEGHHVTLVDAALDEPRPVRTPVPLVVGGSGPRVLRFAAQHADVVGIAGLGRTLDDGHSHAVDWSPAAVERTVDAVGSAAREAGRDVELEALVQHVEITDDASGAAARLAEEIPDASVDDLLRAPYVWIGTIDEIRQKLARLQDELGIGRYVVRAPALADTRRILNDSVRAR